MTPEEAEQKAREIANAPSWDDGMSFSKIDLENLIYDALVGSSCQWQPIETAPRDGTPVLLCDAKTESMRWAVWALHPDHADYPHAKDLGWRDGTIEAGGSIVGIFPTHWMPLPAPPKT